jgi:hypothetical protein
MELVPMIPVEEMVGVAFKEIKRSYLNWNAKFRT